MNNIQKIMQSFLGSLDRCTKMYFFRVILVFFYAYPQACQRQEVAFESLLPASRATRIVALSMQAYGDLLALRSMCGYEDAGAARDACIAINEKLMCFDADFSLLVKTGQLVNVEDVEFLAGVIEKMAQVCQLILLCAPQDEGLLAIKSTLAVLQEKIAALLCA